MLKIKNFSKSRIALVVFSLILCMIYPLSTFAAGEPSNGYYKIKNVGTGQYVTISNGKLGIGPDNNTVFKIEDTEKSPNIKWFSITSGDNAISFSHEDAEASLTTLIPGEIDRYDPIYKQYTRQRFTFGKSRSGYIIQPIAFGNNTQNRVLTIKDGVLRLIKANGSRTQLFVLERQ